MTSTDGRRPSARFTLALLLVAGVAALFAIAFRGALQLLLARWGGAEDVVSAMRRAPVWARIVLPAAGGLLSGLLGLVIARSKQGHGVGDVMEAVVLGRERLSLRVTLLKSLSSWVAIASGGSLGREGPLIQFGGAFGKVVSERFGLSTHHKRRLIAAGTAAGFAAAYNTPFAAALFVVEVVMGVVVLDTLVPVLVATVVAAECTRWIVGAGPVYGARTFYLGSSWELVSIALLGVAGALVAQCFMRLLRWSELRFRAVRLPLRPALGGLVAGAVAAVLPEVAGNGFEPLNAVLDEGLGVTLVLWLMVAKMIATSASVSSGSPGGVFTPSMLLGGGFGYAYGVGLALVLDRAVGAPGGYALVGMAVLIAATTHAPLTAAVMVFELSGDYAIVLPLSLATAIATAVSRSLRRESIYTSELSARGLSWELTLEGRRMHEGAKERPSGPSSERPSSERRLP